MVLSYILVRLDKRSALSNYRKRSQVRVVSSYRTLNGLWGKIKNRMSQFRRKLLFLIRGKNLRSRTLVLIATLRFIVSVKINEISRKTYFENPNIIFRITRI